MISVCIPTYNGALYIKEQLDSILEEIGPNDEVIISDDGSTDDTLDIINGMNDSRITVFTNQLSSSEVFRERSEILLKKVSLNVQNALMKASGDYIFLADQDDIWIKGRVSKSIELLMNDRPSLVISNCKIIDENYSVTEESYFNYVPPSKKFFRTLLKSSFHGCCMCFNRKLLEKTFPFPDYSLGHDLWIGLTAIKYGNIDFIEEPLVLYRRHSSTVTMTGNKSTNSLKFKILYRLKIIFEYFNLKD